MQFTILDMMVLTVLIAFVFTNWRPYWLPVTVLVVLVWLLRALFRRIR